MPDVIDVDALSSDDRADAMEIQLTGFQRHDMPDFKRVELENEGFAYMGYSEPSNSTKRTGKRTSKGKPAQPVHSSRSTSVFTDDVIEISSDEDAADELGPPKKRTKTERSHSKHYTSKPSGSSTPCHQRGHGPYDVITDASCSRDNNEDFEIHALDIDETQNWKQPTTTSGLHLDVDVNDQVDGDLAIQLAQAHVSESCSKNLSIQTQALRLRHHRNLGFDWSQDNPTDPREIHEFQKWQQAATYSGVRRKTRLYGNVCPQRDGTMTMKALNTIHNAPGDVCTVLHSGNMVIVASTVIDGALEDEPGPYNKEGALSIWYRDDSDMSWSGHILNGHKRKLARQVMVGGDTQTISLTQYLTVNDVAIDPSCSTTVVSAGRDRKVLMWDCEEIEDGVKPTVSHRLSFKECPEMLKFCPGGLVLAVQCNDGSVNIINKDFKRKSPLIVAPPQLNHVTADMHWGIGPSHDLLFASSARHEDSTGCHKAFDITTLSTVVEFNANDAACSTLTVEPSGQSIYIATEQLESPYMLYRFDMRDSMPQQTVELEPFAGNPDRSVTDINSLAVSSDGIYIAAARTDNWLDVYDGRMLRRGPLYKFAHEGETTAKTFGVVKAEWVDGVPYGTGFISGGVDGCIRLWDLKRASEDPLNGMVLAQCDYDISTFTVGDMYQREAPLVVGERSGKVTTFGFEVDDWSL